MSPLLLGALLALVPGDRPQSPGGGSGPDVTGKWQIIYAEEGGRRIQAWEQRQATIKDGELTYTRDGKEHSITLKFGAKQTLSATEGGDSGGKGDGVFIAGRDYLCISVSGHTFTGGEGGREARGGAGSRGRSSGNFILILRRQR